MDIETRILKALLEGPLPQNKIKRKSYQTTSISPRVLKERLTLLESEGFIVFENKKTWRRGRKKLYRLTEKGKRKLAESFEAGIKDLLDDFQKLMSFTMGDVTKRQSWQDLLFQSLGQHSIHNPYASDVTRRTYESLNECIRKIHELYLDLGIVSLVEPLRKHAGLPLIDAKFVVENSVLCFDHGASGQEEDDLPFYYVPRKGFKAMMARASPQEKGFAPY